MYNDDESELLEDWIAVLTKMLNMKTLPTIIFYEKMKYNNDINTAIK